MRLYWTHNRAAYRVHDCIYVYIPVYITYRER